MKSVISICEFSRLKPWWRTSTPTEIVLTDDGVGAMLGRAAHEGRRTFFVIDAALEAQPAFARIFAGGPLYLFDATYSEPRTQDVDALRETIMALPAKPDTIVGIGGGASMDLAKATAICLANPEPAEVYQGYGLDMKKGADIWTVPALNGTGAEITPIAVLRGPRRKLGINNPYTESEIAFVDPQLSQGASHFNRFFTMMDCYFHHYEIMMSKTSSTEAVMDAVDGLALSREVLSRDLTEYDTVNAIHSAMASILGGTSTIGGRVGAAHAISYGLSNCAPHLPHSVAVAISMSVLEDVYPDGYADTMSFLSANRLAMPAAADYGVSQADVPKMTKTALGMEKLWHSCFGDDWKKKATPEYISAIYHRITGA